MIKVFCALIIFSQILCVAGFLKMLLPNGPLLSNSIFRPKTISIVVIVKTMSATIAFFSFPPFLFLCQCGF